MNNLSEITVANDIRNPNKAIYVKGTFFIFCMVIAQNLFAQSTLNLRTCEIKLIDTLEAVPGCGTSIFSTAAKCIINSQNGSLNEKDTVVFYVVCPEGYGDNFWVRGNSYKIKYEQFDKQKRYSFIAYEEMKNGLLIPAQNKHKNAGIIKEANKK